MILSVYTSITSRAKPVFRHLLKTRLQKGKEEQARINERYGKTTLARPEGALFWIHAASVGEAQSAQILIAQLLKNYDDIHILVTTGTRTSAQRMKKSLPKRAFHQYAVLDNPDWVERFLDQWQPNMVFWMEYELWPNILIAIKNRNIPCALINARLSKKSFSRWKLFKKDITKLLSTFSIILSQSPQDAKNFRDLGANNVVNSGNLKYSAAPLPYYKDDLQTMLNATSLRTILVYASTHDGEEIIAARIHARLQDAYPDLLSIIIPRHPERGDQIAKTLSQFNKDVMLRGQDKALPDHNTKLYIANTLGELGLFYRLGDIVYVGRSLSADGGGGHNPLEPAQLNCAVIHGKYVQNLRDIYSDMLEARSCICVEDKADLYRQIEWLLRNDDERKDYIQRAYTFSSDKSHVIDFIMEQLTPVIDQAMLKANQDAA